MGEGAEVTPVLLQTARLVLRGDTAADADAVVALWTDPVVMAHMGGPREPDAVREAVMENVASPPEDPCYLWNLVERAGGRFVGNAGLLRKEIAGRDEIELVYLLVRDAWGQGYATEAGTALVAYAFETLGAGQVAALIDPPNERSVRVIERLGFERDQVVRRAGGHERVLYLRKAPTAP